jgi:hypothetical protein
MRWLRPLVQPVAVVVGIATGFAVSWIGAWIIWANLPDCDPIVRAYNHFPVNCHQYHEQRASVFDVWFGVPGGVLGVVGYICGDVMGRVGEAVMKKAETLGEQLTD